MNPNQLHVVAARTNPLRWQTPDNIYKEWAEHILDSGATLTVVECQYGERDFVCKLPNVNHIGVRAKTWCWSKENLLNIGISRIPDAKYICWSDSDVFHRNKDWVNETLHALQNYDVIQPWSIAYDLGPNKEVIQTHTSFCKVYHSGQPVVKTNDKFWKFDGGAYDFPHSGYQWAAKRDFFDSVGGLLEICGMGSGDYHMAMGLVGKGQYSLHGKSSDTYKNHILRWQNYAVKHVNYNIGYVNDCIDHHFHGKKSDRGYITRWGMFVQHQFNPDEDLKKNSYGVFEWAGNKPDLRREFDLYLRSRNEDAMSN